MKTNILFLILIVSIAFGACTNEIDQQQDITVYEWRLQSLTVNNKRYSPPKDNHREKAYMLKFENDSIFELYSSINEAGGKYKINLNNGFITIIDYHEWTKVGYNLENPKTKEKYEFDMELFSAFQNTLYFSIKKDILSLQQKKIVIKLKKQ